MNTSSLLLTATLLGALAACTPATELQATVTPPVAVPGLLGQWQLDSASQLQDIPRDITLSIRKAHSKYDGSLRITGYSGLNEYVSNARVDAAQQRFILSTQIATTQKWGPQPRRDFEQAYLDSLDGVVSYQLAADTKMTLITLKGDTLQQGG